MTEDTEPTINIKDLVLDEPEKRADLPFDPAQEVTSADWEDLKSSALTNQNSYISQSGQGYEPLAEIFFGTQVLFPERAGEIPFREDLKRDLASRIQEYVERHRGLNLTFLSVSLAKHKFGVKPEDAGINSQSFQEFNRRLSRAFGLSLEDMYRFKRCLALALAFPNLQHQLLKAEDNIQNYNQRLETYKKSTEANDNLAIVYLIPLMRLLFPRSATKIDMSQIPWEEIRTIIRQRKDDHPIGGYTAEDFIFNLMAAKLCQSERFIISERGIEVVMPSAKGKVGAEPLPDSRQF